MNRPGVPEGNWTWRLEEGVLTPGVVEQPRTLTRIYARD